MNEHRQPTETVAFLGIGTMGHAMASSALRAGLPTIAWNITPEPARALASRGGEAVDTAAEAARRADIVVTMVTDADAVMAVAVEHGMLAALTPGSVWVQMSTIGAAGIDRVAKLVADERPDVTLVDAPVSGSKVPAEKGQLTIFASGPEQVRPRVTPLFDALGQRTLWVGAVGAGSRMKLVNNTLLAFKAEGLASAIALAHDVGLDTKIVVDALDASPLVSPWDQGKLQRIAKGDYSPEFSLALALKDVHLALDAVDADRFRVLESLARDWEAAADQGFGDEDITAVTQALLKDHQPA